MFKNTYESIIHAPIDKVWFILTDSGEIYKSMKNVKVISDWKLGSTINYTCYDDDGSIMEWEGKKMIWDGIIEVLDKNKEYTITYNNTENGIIKESYFLELIDKDNTKIKVIQDFTTQEIADKYKPGTNEWMEMFKNYLEK